MSKKKKDNLEEQDSAIQETPNEDVPAEDGGKEPCPSEEDKFDVSPKIEAEYLVVMLDCKLKAHQGGGEGKILTDPVYIEFSIKQKEGTPKFDKGAKLEIIGDGEIELYKEKELTTKVDIATPFTNEEMLGEEKLKLWAFGKKAGKCTLKLTVEDTEIEELTIADPLELEMAVIELELELYSGSKNHSKVFFDTSALTYTKLSDENKLKKGVIVQVQSSNRHSRAKIVVKKPDDALWTVGKNDYKVVISKNTDSGNIKLYTAATGGNEKQIPLKIKKTDFGSNDYTLWIEGATETDDFRHIQLDAGIDRPDGGLAKEAKKNGDCIACTVVKIKTVTPDAADYKQYINLDEDANKPQDSRNIISEATLTKPLKDIEILFSLIPDSNNPTDIPDSVKYKKPADNEASVKTDANGKATSAKLKLSRYGGDKFHIAAYVKEAPPAGDQVPDECKSKEIEIWRKIFYRAVCMKRYNNVSYSNRLDEANYVTKMKDFFIEMERTGAVGSKNFKSVVKDSEIANFNTATFGADVTRTINIGLIEAQTGNATSNFNRTWDATDDYDVASKTTKETLTGFTMEMETKAKWLVSAKYRNKDVNPANWIALSKNKVSLALNGLKHEVKVDLSSIVAGGLSANKIAVTVKLKKLSEWSGDSTGKTILIGMRWREIGYPGQEKQSALQTTLHETGHFLGLAPTKIPNAAQDANALHYSSNGSHCKFNTNGCVMYHAFQMVFDFCNTCKSSVKARDISNPQVASNAGY